MSPQSLLLQRYRNVLVPVPPVRDRICATCHRDTDGSTHCFQCARHASVSRKLCDVVVPVSVAIKGEQLAHELWHYKYGKLPEVKRRFTDGLAFVLANFLHRHERHIAAAVGVDGFDLVTVVPGSKPRAEAHPLVTILQHKLASTRRRFEEVLTCEGSNDRGLAPDRFSAHHDLVGRAVLVVDDTWTSGASMQSAAIVLKEAGATRVAGVVIGRHFDPGHANAGSYLGLLRSRPYDWDSCCCCSDPELLS